MIERFLRYLLARFYPEPVWDYPVLTKQELAGMTITPSKKAWDSRVEMIESSGWGKSWKADEVKREARERGMTVYTGKEQAIGMPEEHRGLPVKSFDYSSDARHLQPLDLQQVIERLKGMAIPFLLVAQKNSDGRGVHGWCNGSNYGMDCLKEIATCAELNFKLEMEKLRRNPDAKIYAGHLPGHRP